MRTFSLEPPLPFPISSVHLNTLPLTSKHSASNRDLPVSPLFLSSLLFHFSSLLQCPSRPGGLLKEDVCRNRQGTCAHLLAGWLACCSSDYLCQDEAALQRCKTKAAQRETEPGIKRTRERIDELPTVLTSPRQQI